MDAHHPSTIYGGKAPFIMGITWGETAVALVMVAARLWGASIRRGELRWDFFWVAVACVCGMGSQSLLTVAAYHGLGMHIWELDVDLITIVLKYYWASATVGLFGILSAKVAIIALLLAVKGPNQKKRGYLLHFLWISNLLFIIAVVLMIYFQCRPADAIWDITKLPNANCSLKPVARAVGYAQGAWSACSDIVLALYPISVVWKLQTSLKMKIGFCVLMGGGIIAAISVAIRTYYINTLATNLDVTYAFADFMIWGGTELWCIIILGSIPPLRPLFAKLFGKARGLSSYGSARGTNGYGNGTGQQGYGRGTVGGTKKSGLRSLATIDEPKRQRGLVSVLATGNGSNEEVLPEKQGMGFGGITVHQTFEVVETATRDEVRDLEQGRDGA
ncbi:hypothetical protein MBLNU457_6943t1 [Dothideomycetes sp. NU457]